MGIIVEYNPDLALRNYREYRLGNRKLEECLPETLIAGNAYDFLKLGQRNYWLEGEIPLLETKGEGRLSRPLAGVTILEATHFVKDGKIWTRGRYRVNEVFDISDRIIRFEGMKKI